MKTLRTTLFAGAVGLLSFVGCSHNSSSDRGTTPAPALEPTSQGAAPAVTPSNPSPAGDDLGNTTSPINAPVNDPSMQTSPTGSRLGETPNPTTTPTPSGGLPPTTTPRNDDTLDLSDDTTGQPKNTPPTGTSSDDTTTPPSAQPQTGKLDAGVPPAGAPARDAGTGTGTNKKMDAGTKMNPK